ncbi:branched-chain amino acid ABC transporter permease [Bradyrhizobium sp. WYCCWR 13022]|uniref:branched-chain amino acid ABC transporter permease n=1 Tax=unclassified Bradyrhizobium TaxID=2631580 RepID=UPI00263ABA12|nr:branched-chain amino acid ABC transporter permease [Bradyrhizobium sp. WYCCWR 13022]MDN4984315.1 branched-chain amino acid ABC transporter permease [Bradyrhizobium sp. WYCCWR 13022]
MELLVNQVLAGIATGAIYACMSLSIVMIYQAIDHLNFAQGEMAMASTFIAWQMIQWGFPYWVAFTLTIAISFGVGFALERAIFRPLAKAPVLTHVAGFIALFGIFNSGAGMIWDYTIKEFPTPFGKEPFLGSDLLNAHQAAMFGITAALLALLYFFSNYTRTGLAMRAAVSNPESAGWVGINVGWIIGLGWALAAAIGAVAGMLIAPLVFLDPNMMGGVLIYGFAGAVLGGLNSPLGAVVGGFILGVAENLIGTYLPGAGNQLKLPIVLFVIVAILCVRPQGLMGRTAVERV